jgi:hypothetical protein
VPDITAGPRSADFVAEVGEKMPASGNKRIRTSEFFESTLRIRA